MKDLDYQHLDRISIDASTAELCLDYSEPEQGGTRLLYSFRIPSAAGRQRVEEPTVTTGYAHDDHLTCQALAWRSLPLRVRRDATNWLVGQCDLARQSGRRELEAILADFQRALSEAI